MPYRRPQAAQTRLDDQREAVLGAAASLLAEQGYRGCSMAAVAARAGIATGSVYRHFPSKADLAVELFRAVVGPEVEAVVEAADRPGGPTDRVVAVVETFTSRALKAPLRSYALLAEPVDAVVEAERLVFRRSFRDTLSTLVAEGVAAEVLPPQDPAMTAAALVGAVAEALVGPLSEGATTADVLPELSTFARRALGGADAGHP